MPQEQAPGVISQPQRANAVRIAQQDVYIMDWTKSNSEKPYPWYVIM